MNVQTTRRAILGATMLVPVAVIGCATKLTQSQITADAQDLANMAKGFLVGIQGVTTLPTSVTTAVFTALTTIGTDAQQIATALTPANGTALATEITTAVNTIGLLLTPFFPQAAAIVPLVDAFVSMVDIVVNDIKASNGTTAAALARVALPVTYTPRSTYTRTQAKALLLPSKSLLDSF